MYLQSYLKDLTHNLPFPVLSIYIIIPIFFIVNVVKMKKQLIKLYFVTKMKLHEVAGHKYINLYPIIKT